MRNGGKLINELHFRIVARNLERGDLVGPNDTDTAIIAIRTIRSVRMKRDPIENDTVMLQGIVFSKRIVWISDLLSLVAECTEIGVDNHHYTGGIIIGFRLRNLPGSINFGRQIYCDRIDRYPDNCESTIDFVDFDRPHLYLLTSQREIILVSNSHATIASFRIERSAHRNQTVFPYIFHNPLKSNLLALELSDCSVDSDLDLEGS